METTTLCTVHPYNLTEEDQEPTEVKVGTVQARMDITTALKRA